MTERQQKTGSARVLRHILFGLDALLVCTAMVIAMGLHIALQAHLPFLKNPPPLRGCLTVTLAMLPIWLFSASTFGLDFARQQVWSRAALAWAVARHHLALLVSLSLLLFLTQVDLNRTIVLFFFLSTCLMTYSSRALVSVWRGFQHAQGLAQVRLLLVGAPDQVLSSFVAATSGLDLPPNVLGYLDASKSLAPTSSPDALPPRLGTLDNLGDVLHHQAVDQVLFFPPANDPRTQERALATCETLGVQACFAVELVQPASAPPLLTVEYGRPFLTFELAPRSREALALKHGFDAFAAAACLLLLSPVLLLVALAIWASMGRPILFLQERAGLHGRPFRMLKFRTMQPDAEAQQAQLLAANEMAGPVFKMTDDPRVTRLGRFLRKWSLDELPQLANVLMGTMSLVGPRPLPVKEQRAMRGWHRRRLSMKPGLTGLWQVSGRNDLDFETWMRLDLEYIDHWSFTADLRLLLRTVPAVLSRRGAR